MKDFPYRYAIDANILIDIHFGSILHEMFQLPIDFFTTDFVIAELKNPPAELLLNLGLKREELGGDLIAEISFVKSRHKELSVSDVSVFILARHRNIALLTGDDGLRTLGESSGLEVHGTLWLLDCMIDRKIIEMSRATISLEIMLAHGSRLPQKECEQRFMKWKRDLKRE